MRRNRRKVIEIFFGLFGERAGWKGLYMVGT